MSKIITASNEVEKHESNGTSAETHFKLIVVKSAVNMIIILIDSQLKTVYCCVYMIQCSRHMMASTHCCHLLTIILLLTSVLVASRRHTESYQPRLRHVTRRAGSYSPRLRRDDVEEQEEKEKLPDTNGMFFGKRSSTLGKSLQDSSQMRHRLRQMCKRRDIDKTQLGQLVDCARRQALRSL